ncbi:sulfur carrier protein ThiS adenylyltransferase ThiF [Fundidesulfovibrio terrae]|uniref:sulfur carrier protein ThiS adenylyltransferase ThiF n=1 Tax=Fundidesulfovibrio terrae TaxID=2922866 RepID=UPI001FAFD88F|nr:sulfur carrier protein ThiS adenylyltransferase ThiF [Fundidesulfovibrio terrae]
MNPFGQGLCRYLGPDDLERIRSVRVGIAGAGGLGSNCAWMLVRSGFADFVVVDNDTVDASNLNRQFFFARQVGSPKVEALRENLLAINPEANVRAVQAEVTPDNVRELFEDRDVVVEAFDAAHAKRMIVEAFLGSGKFLVAASGLAGCGDADRIKTHRMKDDFYVVGDLVSQVSPTCPPLSPCVTIAAAKQADLVLEHALGRRQ